MAKLPEQPINVAEVKIKILCESCKAITITIEDSEQIVTNFCGNCGIKLVRSNKIYTPEMLNMLLPNVPSLSE